MSPAIRSGELDGYKPRGSKMGLLLLSGDDGRAEATASACSCVIVLLPLPILVCGGTNAVAVSGRDAR